MGYSPGFLAVGYVLLVSTIIYLLFDHWHYDDPFISYRYARNIAQGLGFVYNPGERALSTTTPLFTLILALFHTISTDLPGVANLIGAISLSVGALLLWDLAHTLQTPEVGWAALILYPTFTLPAASIGSETPLYITLCLAAFAAYFRKRYLATGVLAALAVLARPDGVLVAAVLALDFLVRVRRPIPWTAVFLFSAISLPWFIFAWSYFGSPLPVTLAAKQAQAALAVSQSFLRGITWTLGWYSAGWQYWVEALLAVLGLIWTWRRARSWLLVFLWTAVYVISFAILNVSRYFWYYAPLVPGWIILVGLGVSAIARQVQPGFWSGGDKGDRRESGSPPQRGKGDVRSPSALLLTIAVLVPLSLAQGVDMWKLVEQQEPRAAAYQAVGEWLKNNTLPDSVVGSLEAGVIGYYSGRTMVDFAGLLQPAVAQQLARSATYDEAAIWAMKKYSPDYVVLVKDDLFDLKTEYIDSICQVVQNIPKARSGFTDVSIYHCHGR